MKVAVEEARKPKVVDAKDVVLKVTGTTVCGSDMHLLACASPPPKTGTAFGTIRKAF